MPSAILVDTSWETDRPLAKDRDYAGAPADTTPTIGIFNPSASRAAMAPQMPEPSPICTYKTSRSATVRSNSSE
jgi:hypothetical protein